MNPHDDHETVEQAYARVKKKPHWQWNEYDLDDIENYHIGELLKYLQDRGELDQNEQNRR